jgi:hypothetical protein
MSSVHPGAPADRSHPLYSHDCGQECTGGQNHPAPHDASCSSIQGEAGPNPFVSRYAKPTLGQASECLSGRLMEAYRDDDAIAVEHRRGGLAHALQALLRRPPPHLFVAVLVFVPASAEVCMHMWRTMIMPLHYLLLPKIRCACELCMCQRSYDAIGSHAKRQPASPQGTHRTSLFTKNELKKWHLGPLSCCRRAVSRSYKE